MIREVAEARGRPLAVGAGARVCASGCARSPSRSSAARCSASTSPSASSACAGDARGDRHPGCCSSCRRAAAAISGGSARAAGSRRRMAAADALLYEEIARRRGEPDLDERADVLSLLLRARDEDGRDDDRRRAARRADDDARRRPRDDRDRPRVRLRPPAAQPRRAGAADATSSTATTTPTSTRWSTETLRLRPVIDAAERTLKAPRTVAGWELPAGHPGLPGDRARPPPRGPLPEPGRFRPERFLDDGAESYTWLPVRRRHPALHRRGARAGGDGRGAARDPLARRAAAGPRRDPDPVVLRGITLSPRHGVPVRVVAKDRSPARAAALAA